MSWKVVDFHLGKDSYGISIVLWIQERRVLNLYRSWVPALKRKVDTRLLLLTKKLFVNDTCWQRENRFFSRGVSLSVSPTLQGRHPNSNSMFLFMGLLFVWFIYLAIFFLTDFFVLIFIWERGKERKRQNRDGWEAWLGGSGRRLGRGNTWSRYIVGKNVINKKEMVVHGARRGRFSPGSKGSWELCKMWKIGWWGTTCEEKPGKNGTLAQECWGRG